MKRRYEVIVILFMIIGISSMSFFNNITYAKSENVRKIVVFEDGVDNTKKDDVLEKYGASIVNEVEDINAVVVNVSSSSQLSSDENVRYVEDDAVVSISVNASYSIPTFKIQPPEVIPWGVRYMRSSELLDVSKSDLIKVAVIDTGVDIDHPDLEANIKGGYNSIVDIADKSSYDDDNGHGTHVAGIIAAEDNSIGVVGVASKADLYAVKALDDSGYGYISDIIEGVQWCIDNDMDIINMSFGSTEDSVALHEVIQNAYASGIIMVAAAGNNYGGSSNYPAAYDEVISVGAIDYFGNIADFSAISGVDAWAPGKFIYSTYNNGLYYFLDGTSMAAPHWICKIINNF